MSTSRSGLNFVSPDRGFFQTLGARQGLVRTGSKGLLCLPQFSFRSEEP